MKQYSIVLVLSLTLISSIMMAQTASSKVIEDFKPSSLNQPGKDFPQVNSQGYACFRIEAPAADSVRVSLGLGGKGGTKLMKSADGFWTGNYRRAYG